MKGGVARDEFCANGLLAPHKVTTSPMLQSIPLALHTTRSNAGEARNCRCRNCGPKGSSLCCEHLQRVEGVPMNQGTQVYSERGKME